MTSSSLNLSPSGPRSYLNAQPPRSHDSDPPGSSITPSTDTNSETTILPISASSSRVCTSHCAERENSSVEAGDPARRGSHPPQPVDGRGGRTEAGPGAPL